MSTIQPPVVAAHARPAPPSRRTAFVAGALYLVTFLTSVPTLALYRPVQDRADFVLGAGSATSVRTGAWLEVLLAVSCVGTAVVLFPVVRRHSERAALGFVASRLVEGGLILVGVASMLSIVTLRQDAATSGPASLLTAGQALVAVYNQTFLLSQSLMPAISALCLGSIMYRSGLVPRSIPLLGLAGAPLLLASDTAILWGAYGPTSPLAALAALPVAVWELSLAAWLVFRGFLPVAPATYPKAIDDTVSGT